MLSPATALLYQSSLIYLDFFKEETFYGKIYCQSGVTGTLFETGCETVALKVPRNLIKKSTRYKKCPG